MGKSSDGRDGKGRRARREQSSDAKREEQAPPDGQKRKRRAHKDAAAAPHAGELPQVPNEPEDSNASTEKAGEDPMELAIRLAKRSAKGGGGPFGAVVVRHGKVVATGVNSVVAAKDPTSHAEIAALRAAAQALSTHDLSDCELYSSCEPCPMCLGAIYWARIKRVWYACDREDAAAAGFDDAFVYEELERKPHKRKIPMRRVLRKRGLKAFQAWLANPDRQPY